METTHAQTFPQIGQIEVWAGEQLIKVTISDRHRDFIAACVIKGSIWFESATTGIDALLNLTKRIQGAN